MRAAAHRQREDQSVLQVVKDGVDKSHEEEEGSHGHKLSPHAMERANHVLQCLPYALANIRPLGSAIAAVASLSTAGVPNTLLNACATSVMVIPDMRRLCVTQRSC